ncbi:DNA starvation/stationary phase protection protein [Paenibacillus sp. FSL H7-0716]|uniref:DNA starvation/stationary phase protection protein n=1 Tax=Paenibacillus odorifer TaxID=189426 RepID=A0A1R0YRN2_9BACL|nr:MULTISPECIES: DNA starvation/stationary phase protection protein [Paenibacillus]AWV32670.1 DNA starvation/stationary phase protection protein [Paenibacillus odorifer]MDH6426172.1 starvation-inducible DNA-binding protein [Paenibacillus sp. PastH-4]MDH6442194.1 starvation-inducible DNA-binding protein [Paenibacillus sp. PastF-4]MDH6527092.1 starvation-inducible DNA-binding protein [Paenibacillus sp. PastH-3]OMD69686.1 DNA starvation/stationary phase protection protein [Paenibacillus odorifer]
MAKASNKVNTTSLEQIMNRQVANLNVLYVKIHNFHWYVKGEQFFSLHVKFEELYNEVTLQMDEVAERLLTIKGSPAATLKEYLELATIQEATGKEDTRGMVQSLIEDFATISEELTEGIELAEETKDQPTSDMFIKIRSDLEKHQWMLRSFLS